MPLIGHAAIVHHLVFVRSYAVSFIHGRNCVCDRAVICVYDHPVRAHNRFSWGIMCSAMLSHIDGITRVCRSENPLAKHMGQSCIVSHHANGGGLCLQLLA